MIAETVTDLFAPPASMPIVAVTAGVAFLAAGSIIISRGNVRGVTTGASMWLSGAIGLACGTGSRLLAVIGTGLTLMVLWIIRLTLKPLAHPDKDQATAPKGRQVLAAAFVARRPWG